MEENNRRRRPVVIRSNRIRKNAMTATERIRCYYKPYDGPPPPGFIDALAACKGIEPQPIHPVGLENLDPVILDYMPQFLRTPSGATSGLINPPSFNLTSSAGNPRAHVKGGEGVALHYKDFGTLSTQTLLLLRNLNLEAIHIHD